MHRKSNLVSSEVGEEQKPKKCKADEIMYRGHCLKKAYLGDDCVTKEQCQNGAYCSKGKCRCRPNMAGYRLMCIGNSIHFLLGFFYQLNIN